MNDWFALDTIPRHPDWFITEKPRPTFSAWFERELWDEEDYAKHPRDDYGHFIPTTAKSDALKDIAVDPKLLAKVDDNIGPIVEVRAKDAGISPEAWKAQCESELRAALAEAKVRIAVPGAVMVQILASGKVENQWETGHALKFVAGLGDRGPGEQALFSIPQTAPPEKHPIYGYVWDKSDSRPGEGHLAYLPGEANKWDDPDARYPMQIGKFGMTNIVLKDDVKERTTFIAGDSLVEWCYGHGAAPSPMSAPKYYSAFFGAAWVRPKGDPNGPRVLSGKTLVDPPEVTGAKTTWAIAPYVEAQVHGGVSVSDIDHLVVYGGGKVTDAVAEAAAAAGVPVVLLPRWSE